MIQIESLGDEYLITFKGENFNDIYDVFQTFQYSFTYNDVKRGYVCSRQAVKGIIPHLERIEPIKYKTVIPNDINIKFYRGSVKKDYHYTLPPRYAFQDIDIQKVIKLNKVALFHKQGYGKTYISLTALNHHYEANHFQKLVIITSPESVYNWKYELIKFSNFCKEDEIYIVSTENRLPFQSDKKVIVMNYRNFIMLNDDAYYKKYPAKKGKNIKYTSKPIMSDLQKWANGGLIACVCDESHYFMNIKSKTYKLLKKYKDCFEIKMIMTGTPAPNTELEVYPQFNFLEDTLIDMPFDMWQEYLTKEKKKFERTLDEEKIKEFYKKVSPYVIRRVAEPEYLEKMPDLIYKDYYADLNAKQEKIYQAVANHGLKEMEKNFGFIPPEEFLGYVGYIVQAIDNPCLLKKSFIEKYASLLLEDLLNDWKFSDHSKLKLLDDLIERCVNKEKDKVIIWDFHPDTLDQLKSRYSSIKSIIYHGNLKGIKNKSAEKFRVVEEFQNSDSKILFASMLAINSSVNIQKCRYNIYFSKAWGLVQNDQSITRTYRSGQKRDTFAYSLLLGNSIDVTRHYKIKKKVRLDRSLFKDGALSLDTCKSFLRGIE
ncbi:MAG: hypothetical protein GF311_28325 [Candidatus Lokiarchaeota archaeon]|nr:hypothetical protein [Candidatus Lokiarchaeota archaeon]